MTEIDDNEQAIKVEPVPIKFLSLPNEVLCIDEDEDNDEIRLKEHAEFFQEFPRQINSRINAENINVNIDSDNEDDDVIFVNSYQHSQICFRQPSFETVRYGTLLMNNNNSSISDRLSDSVSNAVDLKKTVLVDTINQFGASSSITNYDRLGTDDEGQLHSRVIDSPNRTYSKKQKPNPTIVSSHSSNALDTCISETRFDLIRKDEIDVRSTKNSDLSDPNRRQRKEKFKHNRKIKHQRRSSTYPKEVSHVYDGSVSPSNINLDAVRPVKGIIKYKGQQATTSTASPKQTRCAHFLGDQQTITSFSAAALPSVKSNTIQVRKDYKKNTNSTCVQRPIDGKIFWKRDCAVDHTSALGRLKFVYFYFGFLFP